MGTDKLILAGNAAELREKILQDKAARRRYLTRAPIPEKLRILEVMRDTTRALRQVREQKQSTTGKRGCATVIPSELT
jgi:hypothetical protein